MNRDEITTKSITDAQEELIFDLKVRLKNKGNSSFASIHEIYGILAEEVKELLDELHNSDTEKFRQELLDIGVVCLFGIACIDQGAIEW